MFWDGQPCVGDFPLPPPTQTGHVIGFLYVHGHLLTPFIPTSIVRLCLNMTSMYERKHGITTPCWSCVIKHKHTSARPMHQCITWTLSARFPGFTCSLAFTQNHIARTWDGNQSHMVLGAGGKISLEGDYPTLHLGCVLQPTGGSCCTYGHVQAAFGRSTVLL